MKRNNQNRLYINSVNQAINLFWTCLFFAPVIYFWIQYYNPALLFVLLGLSLIPLLMNETSLWTLQLSRKKKLYEQLGIRKLQAVTQNGKLVKKLLGSQPGYKVVRNRKDIASYKIQIGVYEKYHLVCFLFFTVSAIYGLINAAYI